VRRTVLIEQHTIPNKVTCPATPLNTAFLHKEPIHILRPAHRRAITPLSSSQVIIHPTRPSIRIRILPVTPCLRLDRPCHKRIKKDTSLNTAKSQAEAREVKT
jgi:hypothetical protein